MYVPWLWANSWLLQSWREQKLGAKKSWRRKHCLCCCLWDYACLYWSQDLTWSQPVSYLIKKGCFADWNLEAEGVHPSPKVCPFPWPRSNTLSLKDQSGLPGAQENRASDVSSVPSLSHVRLFATPWTAAHQASLSITNSRSPPKLMSIE